MIARNILEDRKANLSILPSLIQNGLCASKKFPKSIFGLWLWLRVQVASGDDHSESFSIARESPVGQADKMALSRIPMDGESGALSSWHRKPHSKNLLYLRCHYLFGFLPWAGEKHSVGSAR